VSRLALIAGCRRDFGDPEVTTGAISDPAVTLPPEDGTDWPKGTKQFTVEKADVVFGIVSTAMSSDELIKHLCNRVIKAEGA
jgi:hypothetical protein